MKRKKLISLVLSVIMASLAFASCFSTNLNSIPLSGIASADTGSATGRTIILTIGSPTMFVNGVGQEIDPGYNTVPVIVNGRTCLPIRALIGDAGTVNWDATQRKVTITLNNTTVVLTIGSKNATVNGRTKTMDVAPFLSSTGRTMLPLRFIIENLDMKVDWYAASRTVVVTMNSATPTINVTQPTSSTNWQAGSTHTISWNYSNLTGTVSIDLLEGGATTTITSSASVGSGGSGSYTWTPSSSLDAGSDYRIRVRSNSNAAVSGASNYFTISNPKPSITVTQPTSSTNWKAGTTHTISWDYTNLSSSSTVKIELYQGSAKVETIDTDIDVGSGGSGSYKWTIDSSLDAASDYKIRVRSESNSSIYDDSSRFTITNTNPSITVTQPTSGANWKAGSSYTITWKYANLDSSSTVTIELLKGSSVVDTIVEDRDIGSGGSGSYKWTIDSDLSAATNYRIRITSDDDDSVYNTSDYFAITVPTPTITVKSPTSGASWKVGTSHTITWTYTNLDSSGTVKIDLYKGSAKVETIDTGIDVGSGGSGSYKWTIDSDLAAATTYKIKISSEDVSCTGTSSSFKITK